MYTDVGQVVLLGKGTEKQFTFDGVYPAESTSEQIYNDIVFPLVEVSKSSEKFTIPKLFWAPLLKALFGIGGQPPFRLSVGCALKIWPKVYCIFHVYRIPVFGDTAC